MPTGGVSLDNVEDWIKAGAVVGVGGALTKGAKTGDYESITKTAEEFIAKIRKARKITIKRGGYKCQKSSYFGEIMLRLSPPEHQRFVQANSFEVVYGGGEANVAVSLANYGLNAAFVTKLPNNPIGDAAINELRKYSRY